jgi:hypothetical protein
LKVPAQSPLRTAGHAMAFDRALGRVLSYGGGDGWSRNPPDTWIWDGANWSKIGTATRPSLVASYEMVSLPGAGGTILASLDGPIRTWEWIGNDWRAINLDTDPGPRAAFALAPDESQGGVILFGGTVPGTVGGPDLRDTWRLTKGGWLQVADVFFPFGEFELAYDTDRDRVLLVGNVQYLLQGMYVYSWSETGFRQEHYDPVMPHFNNRLVMYHRKLRQLVAFGGNWPSASNDTWLYDGTQWRLDPSPIRPPIDYGAGAKICSYYDPGRDRIVVLPPLLRAAAQVAWEYGETGWSSRPIGNVPGSRSLYSVSYDVRRRVAVVFGGEDRNGLTDETLEWDGTSWRSLFPTPRPVRRGLATLTFSPSTNMTILLSGLGGVNNWLLDDVWQWNGTQWAQIQTPSVPSGNHVQFGPFSWCEDTGRSRLLIAYRFQFQRPSKLLWEVFADRLRVAPFVAKPGESAMFSLRFPGESGLAAALFLSDGVTPGLRMRYDPALGYELLPLRQGPLLDWSAGLGLLNVLDASGAATWRLPIPNDSRLQGLQLNAAAISARGGGPWVLGSISNPVGLQIGN